MEHSGLENDVKMTSQRDHSVTFEVYAEKVISMLWLKSQLDLQGPGVPENAPKSNTHLRKIGVTEIMKEKSLSN